MLGARSWAAKAAALAGGSLGMRFEQGGRDTIGGAGEPYELDALRISGFEGNAINTGDAIRYSRQRYVRLSKGG